MHENGKSDVRFRGFQQGSTARPRWGFIPTDPVKRPRSMLAMVRPLWHILDPTVKYTAILEYWNNEFRCWKKLEQSKEGSHVAVRTQTENSNMCFNMSSTKQYFH